MASAILSSAKHGAYIAIGFYVALVLLVSVGAQYQGAVETYLQASTLGHQVSVVAAEQGAVKGAAGA
ncbi:hypothetical protein [Pseudomonas thivervalensis]|uniref:hypothetical protein n=1 Tax=Pseudomonas thivervalensis TaxID=86265 RepID=UPI003D651857